MAIKHVNKKRIELTRQVLLELKHVSVLSSILTSLFIYIYKKKCQRELDTLHELKKLKH